MGDISTIKNILILDSDLTQVSVLTGYETLFYSESYNSNDIFHLKVNLNQLNADELTPGRIIYLDDKRCGFIETVNVNRSTNMMGEMVVASGCGLKDVIKRRVCVTPNGLKIEFASCTTENIIYQLLEKTVINPDDTKRKIDIFTLATEKGLGTERNFDANNTYLSHEIYVNLLPLDELGFKCEVNLQTKKAQLEVYKGLDRTVDQTENPSAVFSLKLGTSIQNTISRDESAILNFVYSGYAYSGDDRYFITMPSENIPEGIDRIESVTVDRYTDLPEDLTNNAQSLLNKNSKSVEISGIMGSGEPDYELGDLVTFLDYRKGDYQNLRVRKIEYSYSGQNPVVKNVYFGSTPSDIAKVFKDRIAPLEKEHLL